MSAPKKKYYVVWNGVEPGVYDSWDECQLQILHFPGAKYKSFPTAEEAVKAFREGSQPLDVMRAILLNTKMQAMTAKMPYTPPQHPGIRLDAIAVDGACAGNPGRMEYRGVRVNTGEEVFRVGASNPLTGTNNIGEYLAIIHAAALLAKQNDTTTPIYSDSRTALSWIRRRASKTTLEKTERTEGTWDLLHRADAWIATHTIPNPILKWNTEEWGEIPADFGRK